MNRLWYLCLWVYVSLMWIGSIWQHWTSWIQIHVTWAFTWIDVNEVSIVTYAPRIEFCHFEFYTCDSNFLNMWLIAQYVKWKMTVIGYQLHMATAICSMPWFSFGKATFFFSIFYAWELVTAHSTEDADSRSNCLLYCSAFDSKTVIVHTNFEQTISVSTVMSLIPNYKSDGQIVGHATHSGFLSKITFIYRDILDTENRTKTQLDWWLSSGYEYWTIKIENGVINKSYIIFKLRFR